MFEIKLSFTKERKMTLQMNTQFFGKGVKMLCRRREKRRILFQEVIINEKRVL